MNTLDFVDQTSLRDDIPAFNPGDTVNVHVKVIEGAKERIQVFKGVVISPAGRRDPRDIYGSQGELRRRRRADLPGALAQHRPHRGGHPWRRSPRQAVLPARTARQEGQDQGKALISARSAFLWWPCRHRDADTAEHATNRPARSEAQPDSGPADPEVATQRPSTRSGAGFGYTRTISPSKRRATLRETVILTVIALVLYYVMLTFVARPYLIPSESMEPTLHGCSGCTGDRIMVDKVTYRFGSPKPGDVIVFKGPPPGTSATSPSARHNTAMRWVQNVLSFIGFVPPDENDLVKRVIAVGGQTVECRVNTGLTVDGKPLNRAVSGPGDAERRPALSIPASGPSSGPSSPAGRLWVMGDNRTHSADSRAHCTSTPADASTGCCAPVTPRRARCRSDNVIGKARFIAWPPSRWGGVQCGESSAESLGLAWPRRPGLRGP